MEVEKMKPMSNKTYDILKWLVVIGLPAISTFYSNLAPVWGWPLADEVSKTLAAVCTLIGALICISTAQYNKGNHLE